MYKRQGLGPIAATKKVMAKTGLTVDDMDLIEANEAFAAQSVSYTHLQAMRRGSMFSGLPCWMELSIMAANRLFAVPMA